VLPMGARVSGMLEGDFLKLENGLHMPRQHVLPLDRHEPDFVAVAERFLGTPYRWGGKTALGLDCSGLVQVALQAAGLACPRDSDMQAADLGEPVPKTAWSHLARGDLVFWRGHVGLMTDPAHLLHANGHHMAVTRELLVTVIGRAEATGSAVTAVRRVKV
jgi:cell wall-associated NlpC family hydrolase